MERIGIAKIVVDVADEEIVIRVELVVDLDGGVLVFFARLAGEKKRAGGAVAVGNGWVWIEGEDFLHRRVERQAGAVLTFAGNVGEEGDEAVALIVEEEEGFVFLDGSADRTAIQVADVGILRLDEAGDWIDIVIEVVARTESVPTAEVEQVAMEIVGAAASDDVDDRAVVTAVLGSEIVGENAEFLRGVRILRGDAAEVA